MTTQVPLRTRELESSSKTVWRGHISCPPKKKEERLRKQKNLMQALDVNMSELHWRCVETLYDLMY